ncbi:MAG TPA: efflux RND transporter periplasmic adaptor subunit [Polyangiaceae bacterium]
MKTRIVLLVLLVVVVAGTALGLRSRSKKQAAAAAASASAMADRTIPVQTAVVAQKDVPIWLDGLGSVAAYYTVTVKSQVDGRLDAVKFTEGQKVKKGDVLAQIDPRPFSIQLLQAQAALARDSATLKNAQLNDDRFKTLRQQNLISEQQLTDQDALVAQSDGTVKSDQAAIDTARLNLDYARIVSPIDGVVGVRQVDPGNIIHASDATGLVVVTQLDPIAVFFTLPEDDLPKIADAMGKGELTVEAYSRDGGQKLGEGKLAVIDNQINQATATAKLKAIFPNPQSTLWPNQFVKARLQLATRKNALTMPAAVVQQGPKGAFAYVVQADSTAAMKPVVVDSIQGETAIVTSGVAPGDQVVVDGQAQLRPGAKVAAKAMAAGSASSARNEASPSSSGTQLHESKP